MKIETNITRHQICFIPTFGIVDRTHYFGYRVFSIAFMWLKFQCCFVFGVKNGGEQDG